MSDDINQRGTAALRALEAAGVIKAAWLPGMRDTEAGAICIEYRDGSARWAVDDWISEWCEDEGAHDISDPVTAASLIVLVREAWGDPKIHTRFSESKQHWEVVRGRDKAEAPARWPGDKRGRIISGAVMEAEALVTALEAKAQGVTP